MNLGFFLCSNHNVLILLLHGVTHALFILATKFLPYSSLFHSHHYHHQFPHNTFKPFLPGVLAVRQQQSIVTLTSTSLASDPGNRPKQPLYVYLATCLMKEEGWSEGVHQGTASMHNAAIYARVQYLATTSWETRIGTMTLPRSPAPCLSPMGFYVS